MAGLIPSLQEKVRGKFPGTFDEALHWAREKDCKLQFQADMARRERQPIFNEKHTQPPPVAPPISEDPHLELLQKVTAQLDDLSINLVQGPRAQPLPHHEARALEAQQQRRPPMRRQDLHRSMNHYRIYTTPITMTLIKYL